MALMCRHTEDSIAACQMSVCHTEDNIHRVTGYVDPEAIRDYITLKLFMVA